MKFNPEKCRIPDEIGKPFIDPEEIWDFINNTKSTPERVRALIQKSLNKERLTMEETAVLVNTTDPALVEEIKEGARELKRRIYGNRIVLFAPLYVGNYCVNNCKYCGFRSSNHEQVRTTLTDEEFVHNIEALEDDGQKRLILVYGESPKYSPEFIAHTTRLAYSVHKGNGSIRRVNINAAPLDVEGFRIVKEAGIGTYQIFQETYHPEAYSWYHPANTIKGNYEWRLTAMDRAQQAGIDDNGLGILFGLYDWRFEVLAMIRHTNHLEACFNVGPHTISFPRIKDASGLDIDKKYFVDDETFEKIIAIFRLAVPYTGMILTARENAEFRATTMKRPRRTATSRRTRTCTASSSRLATTATLATLSKSCWTATTFRASVRLVTVWAAPASTSWSSACPASSSVTARPTPSSRSASTSLITPRPKWPPKAGRSLRTTSATSMNSSATSCWPASSASRTANAICISKLKNED